MSDCSSDTEIVSGEKPYLRYTDDQRRRLYDRVPRLRYGPFDAGQKRATWEEIAAALGSARSTISEWRELDDYKQAEVRYRKLLREEGRSSASGMAQTALDHLGYLMLNARSAFVQLEATKEILKITNIEKELEEAQVDACQELVALQKVLLKRKLAGPSCGTPGSTPTASSTRR